MNLAIRGIDAQIAHADTLPPRPPPRPQGRLRPGQSALQRQRLARRPAARTTSAGSTACRPRATPTSPGCSTSSTTSRPTGLAGFVLANGSMSSNQSGEGEIRKAIIEADLVDCMVALPGQLFYSTQIPVCLWFLARNKKQRPLPRPPRRDAVHRRPQAGHAGRPRPPRADRRRHREDRRHLPRLARRQGRGRVRRRARLLQERDARRDPQARPRAHARPLRRRRGGRGRRRAVRGEDEAARPRRCASSRPKPRSSTPPSPPT